MFVMNNHLLRQYSCHKRRHLCVTIATVGCEEHPYPRSICLPLGPRSLTLAKSMVVQSSIWARIRKRCSENGRGQLLGWSQV